MARAARDDARPLRPPPPRAALRRTGVKAWLARVPPAVYVTIIGGLLTVLILPAFTRQWDDRQKERELKLNLVKDITTDGVNYHADVIELLDAKQEINKVSGRDGFAVLGITAALRAYFPDAVVNRWNAVSDRRERLITVSFVASPLGHELTRDEALQLRRDMKGLLGETEATRIGRYITSPGSDLALRQGEILNRQLKLDEILQEHLVDDIFAADLAGFSTTRRDLFHDITGI